MGLEHAQFAENPEICPNWKKERRTFSEGTPMDLGAFLQFGKRVW
jgi:hypothetical protein